MNIIYKAHYLVGTVFLVLFLMSGIYMFLNFPDLYAGREEIRMMYRATHIYILMSALLNLMTGNYLRSHSVKNLIWLRSIASLLILLAPFLLIIAFVIEPPSYLIDRPVSYWGVVILFVGVLVHSLLNLKWFQPKAQKEGASGPES